MSRKVKSVSFNLCDPWEKEIWEHLQQYPNFSSYVKRLIEHSIQDGDNVSVGKKTKNYAEVRVKDNPVIDKEYISQIL